MQKVQYPRDFARKNAGSADDKLEIKGLLDSLKERDAEIKSWCEKATNEIKETGKVAGETKSALEKLSEEGIKANARILELEQKLARRGGGDDNVVKSIGEMMTESDDFKAFAQKGRGTARINLKAVSNITSATSGQGGVGVAIAPDRLAGVQGPALRQFVVRDLIMPGRTASNAIEYVQESGFTNSAAPVAEGAQKPQSDLSFELKTTTVKTIAHWFRASKQVLADVPLLQSYINGRAIYGLKYVEEAQLLSGDGTGQNILGLIPQATAFDDDRRVTGDTRIDTLRHAILQVRLAEYRATGIVLNPVDWEGIELQKDSTGQYIWVNVQDGGQQRMWKLPVVDTTAIAEGEFLVGAFDLAAQVFDREDAAVEVSTEDADNFTKNMVTIRAEERLAMAVYRPESFVHGTFAAA
ncbi:phage major capsid protein [Caballeronia sp. LZ043]|uniref:phage major capsid protein n=1 Tax=Caballeronia sp. LZ043 TaxID=3038569 RepID=UPI002858D460|nr:phage major capsid protein [Caballeronia sp. LZ043]MDR5825838.1 phage major capsid protein [Caballeronia sp. LZ043]